MQITRVDPMDVDLDLADRLAALDLASHARAGLQIRPPTGPRTAHLLPARQRRPTRRRALGGASDGDEEIGWLLADLPWRDNLGMAGLRGLVHPDHRRRGVGGRLLDEALALHRRARPDRPPLRSVPSAPTASPSSRATGSPSAGQHVYAIRRLDLHHGGANWDRLHDEAAAVAADYELLHVVGADPRRAAGRDGRPARGDQRRARRRGQRAGRVGRRPAARVRRDHGPAPADDVPRPRPARGRPASSPG